MDEMEFPKEKSIRNHVSLILICLVVFSVQCIMLFNMTTKTDKLASCWLHEKDDIEMSNYNENNNNYNNEMNITIIIDDEVRKLNASNYNEYREEEVQRKRDN